MGRVISAKEKHDTRLLVADTDEQLHESALALLRERFEEGYWYYDPRKEKHPFSLDLNEKRDKLLELGEERAKELGIEDRYQRAVEDKASDERAINLIERIEVTLENENGYAAWRILQERRNAEYEYVELKYVG